ncbi:hypothetical protein BJF84_21420 [Rhodococcus sp. CUA-806]|nr:hypothetical protein BJF84_21420 [Rhodococcus sp. CUA-806]
MTAVEPLPGWEDLAHLPDRYNDLMRQNWLIINEILRLFHLHVGNFSDDVVQQMQDLWGETVDIERKLKAIRAPELDSIYNQHH